MTLVKTSIGAEWLDVDDAKAHLRITSSDEDALLTTMLARARERAETDAGMTLSNGAAWTFQAQEIPDSAKEIRLPFGPVRSITTFTYTAANGGGATAVPSSAYSLRGGDAPAIVRNPGQSWPSQADPQEANVEITYVAGDILALSADGAQAILLMLGHMYEHREAFVAGVKVEEVPQGYAALIRKLKARVPHQRVTDAKDSKIGAWP